MPTTLFFSISKGSKLEQQIFDAVHRQPGRDGI